MDGRRSTIPFVLKGVFNGARDDNAIDAVGLCIDCNKCIAVIVGKPTPVLSSTFLLIDLRSYFLFGGPGVGGRLRL